MRVLVCGGRDFKDWDLLSEELTYLLGEIDVIIHGGAKGADRLAGDFAFAAGITEEVYLAKWDEHGLAAGPIRNQRMLDDGKPDLVIAFPGGKGTADMVRRARAAGVEVREVSK
jgi:hypothetical protein